MELLLVITPVLLGAGAWGARRRLQAVAWDRELDEAFGPSGLREMPRRSL